MEDEKTLFNSCSPRCGSQRLLKCIAANPDTPESILMLLITYSTAEIIERIAENPKAGPGIVRTLASHPLPRIRSAVCDHKSLKAEIIWRLAMDSEADVRYAVAENANVPHSVLKMLSEDENPYVANRAARTLAKLASVSNTTVNMNLRFQQVERKRKTS